MKNLIRTSLALVLIFSLASCGSTPTYDAPLEPGQTVFQGQGDNGANNIPEPGQTQMKSSDDDNVVEPGQTDMN